MSKKVISILLSAAMLVAMLCVGVGAVTASADGDMNTYYFLAPDNYFKTDKGAANEQVAAYWWTGPDDKKPASWPGIVIDAAPDVGENVFKVEAPASVVDIIFNANVNADANPDLRPQAHQTVNINCEGYDPTDPDYTCPYDANLEQASFDGWIYVLKNGDITEGTAVSDAVTTGGAWFTLDNYKNNADYYGSYGFEAAADTDEATDTDVTSDTEAPVATGKWHAGDTAIAQVNINDLTDGNRLGAYNYNLSYDTNAVEYIAEKTKAQNKLDGALGVVNANEAGIIKIAIASDEGFGNEDFEGDKKTTFEIKFNVLKDAADDAALGITGSAAVLSVIPADGSDPVPLVNKDQPNDTYTYLTIEQDCPHDTDSENPSSSEAPSSSETSSTTSSETSSTTSSETSSTTSSETSSAVVSSETPVDSSKVVSSETGKNPSTVSSKTTSTSSTTSGTSSTSSKKETDGNASSKTSSTTSTKTNNTTTGNNTSVSTVATAGTFAVVTLVVILMAAAAVVLYTRKKTEE